MVCSASMTSLARKEGLLDLNKEGVVTFSLYVLAQSLT